MAMRGGRFLTIGTLLRLLLGVMLSVLVAALMVPTWTAIQQQDAATKAVAVTRVGQSVFTALQFLRPERGSIHAAVDAAAPADAALLANVATLRSKAAPAIEAVLRDCVALGCATTDDPQSTPCGPASADCWPCGRRSTRRCACRASNVRRGCLRNGMLPAPRRSPALTRSPPR